MLFKNKYRIESSRLKGYDYSNPGAYFITIVTKNRKCYFGNIGKNKMVLNEFGKIVKNYWREIPDHFPNVILDEFVIMPDHLHGIIFIDYHIKPANVSIAENNLKIRQPIGIIINQFKRICTIEIRKIEINFGWQSRFHDHIIRDEKELIRIRQYILDNPLKWKSGENLYN